MHVPVVHAGQSGMVCAGVGFVDKRFTVVNEAMAMIKATERKTISQVVTLGRKLKRESCSWRLVRYVGTTRGGFVDVQSWTGTELDLFGMLATMVVFRDHARGPGMMTLSVYTCAGVVGAARVKR